MGSVYVAVDQQNHITNSELVGIATPAGWRCSGAEVNRAALYIGFSVPQSCHSPCMPCTSQHISAVGYLASTLLGETNAEHAQDVAICGLNLNMGLDQSLPLAHQTAQLVCGEVHALHGS